MPSSPSRRGRTRGNVRRPQRGALANAATQPVRRRRRASLRPGRRHRKLRVLVVLATVLFSVAGGLVAAAFIAYASYRTQLPDAATVAAMEPPLDSHVYDTKGNLIAVFNDAGVRHVHATLDNISNYARLATIDVEDRHFYSEGSWDLPRLVKAGWDNLRHTNTSGASTITEQLAKLSFFNGQERSLDYKIKEIVLGNELDANFTKNQILEMYLNRVSYGNHAVGIETAAELYFFKSAKDLDLAQASMLAGLPQSPTVYNPAVHDPGVDVNPASKARQKVVLDAMVGNGDITQKQANAAYAEKLAVHSWAESEPNPYPSVKDYVQRWLNYNYGSTYVNPGGWDIYTTVDPVLQKAAETSLHDGIGAIRAAHNAGDGALVNIDPKTGKVLAMVGAWDYSDPTVGQTNMALNTRSPGSAIKLFTYTAAIASHLYTMTTPIVDAPIHIPIPDQAPYSPQNYDRRYHGTCEVKSCLGNSLNVPAVKVEVATGVPYITSLEIAAGITTYENPANRPCSTCYSATLGGFPVTPLELADAAATLADLGVHHDPSPVDHIIVRDTGQHLFTLDPASTARRVVPENVAFIIDEITSNDANRVMDFGAHGPLTLPDRRVSAKTGTAEYFNDNWTIGWTPDVVTAVWVGNPYGSCLKPSDRDTMQRAINRGHVLFSGMDITYPFSPEDLAHYGLQPANNACGHLDNSDGVTGAAPIWHKDMVAATAGFSPKDWYTVPKDVTQVGTGDNANFYLIGNQGATVNPGVCYYWGPPGTPPPPPGPNGQSCVYTGTGPPASTPAPTPVTTLPPGPTPKPPHGPHPTNPPGG